MVTSEAWRNSKSPAEALPKRSDLHTNRHLLIGKAAKTEIKCAYTHVLLFYSEGKSLVILVLCEYITANNRPPYSILPTTLEGVWKVVLPSQFL